MQAESDNRVKGRWQRKSRLEKKLLICCVFLAILSLVFVYLYCFKSFSELKQNINSVTQDCNSKHYVKAASEVFDFVDLDEDPCENFYKYVCGSYHKHAVKKDTPSPFVTIKNTVKNEMKSLIVDPIRKKDAHAQVLVKTFYHECMNETKIDEDKNKGFLKAIEALGGWPMLDLNNWQQQNISFDWIELMIKSTILGLPIKGFISFEKVTEYGKSVLSISANKDLSSYISKETLNDVIRDILTVLGLPKFDSNHSDANAATYNFMKKLNRISILSMSSEEIDVKSISDLQKDCPSIPWLEFLNSISGNDTMFDKSSQVSYGDIGQFCEELDKLLNSTKPWIIANYFIWNLITQTEKYLSSDIRKAYSAVHSYTPSRFYTCYEAADERFKFVKETIYVRKKTPIVVREQLKEMINIMKEVLVKHLRECDWMDEVTKKRAIGKAEAILEIIGGGDDLYDEKGFDQFLGVDGLNFSGASLFEMVQQKTSRDTQHFFKTLYQDDAEDWPSLFKNLMEPNAFFVQPLNTMIIPAPILSSIFYDHRKPAFMNYGSLGRIVGHELVHGFEKSGRHVLTKGGMVNWWSNATSDGYDKKVQCVIDSYEEIKFRYKMNGTLTLDENVSDLVGIDIAYESYKKYIEKHGTECKLPGLSLTPEQIFWIQTGTFLCFRKLEDSSVDFDEEDEHGIPIYRVQAGARNSKYFAKDFNCAEGTFMNPKNKCRVL